MQQITKEQIIAIKTMVGRLKYDSEELAYSFSEKRTGRVSHLCKKEATALIKWLLNEQRAGQGDQTDVMKYKILSMAHEMHWELPFARKGKSNEIDMDRVDNWCIRSGYLHKPLDMYTYEELPKLVTQFEQVYKSFLKGI